MATEKKHDVSPSSLLSTVSTDATFSWWTWRPGLKPLYALALGGILSIIGLLLTSLGLFLLVFSIWDQHSPLQPVPATVLHHQASPSSDLTLHLSTTNLPATTSLSVPKTAYQRLTDGTSVQVLYSQHLQVPLAIKAGRQRYILTETSSLNEPGTALLPLLLGLLLLCYPAILAHWGWRDLLIRRLTPEYIPDMAATVVGKRTLQITPADRPGRISVGRGHIWYGIALQSARSEKPQAIVTFSVGEEQFSRLEEGDHVQVRYSPHLHYVYAIEHLI
ncbi:MAG TPA: hypothetical protein VL485_27130 [Ktedonobacteraceae bacterium]|nr:hypothetical protein [Ktedonobacteraceae bacterium]